MVERFFVDDEEAVVDVLDADLKNSICNCKCKCVFHATKLHSLADIKNQQNIWDMPKEG